jgi:hypothetical protein
MEETIDHTPQVWTAGQLRTALAELADDAPLHVGVADGPGDFEGYSEYALIDLEPVEKELRDRGKVRTEKAGRYEHDLV